MFAANVGQVVVRVGFPLVGFEFGDLLEAVVGVVVVATLGASEVVAQGMELGKLQHVEGGQLFIEPFVIAVILGMVARQDATRIRTRTPRTSQGGDNPLPMVANCGIGSENNDYASVRRTDGDMIRG